MLCHCDGSLDRGSEGFLIPALVGETRYESDLPDALLEDAFHDPENFGVFHGGPVQQAASGTEAPDGVSSPVCPAFGNSPRGKLHPGSTCLPRAVRLFFGPCMANPPVSWSDRTTRRVDAFREGFASIQSKTALTA